MSSPRYTNCPTCGGLCEYVSKNFLDAEVLIRARDISLITQLKELSREFVEQEDKIKNFFWKDLVDLTSKQLFDLYLIKVQEEAKEEREIYRSMFESIYDKAKTNQSIDAWMKRR